MLNCTDDYALNGELGPEERYRGEYLIGIDFGKHADHSAIAILQKLDDNLRLVYLKEFPLETPYAAVIGTVRRLNEAYGFAAGYLDQTGVGEAPYEEIRRFMRTMEGVTLTAPAEGRCHGQAKTGHGTRRTHAPKRQFPTSSPNNKPTMRTNITRISDPKKLLTECCAHHCKAQA